MCVRENEVVALWSGIFKKAPKPKAFVYGNSHTECVRNALKDDPGFPRSGHYEISILRPEKISKTGEAVFGIPPAECYEIMKDAPPGSAIFLMIKGEYHSLMSMLKPEIPFDFVLPDSDLPVRDDYDLIPYRLVEENLKGLMKKPIGQMSHIRTISDAPIYYIESPPPKGDRAHITRQGRIALLNVLAASAEINDDSIRLKTWLAQRAIIQRYCAKADVTYLPVPDEAVTSEGLLKREYSFTDEAHGNEAYGALLLGRIDEIMQQQEATR